MTPSDARDESARSASVSAATIQPRRHVWGERSEHLRPGPSNIPSGKNDTNITLTYIKTTVFKYEKLQYK